MTNYFFKSAIPNTFQAVILQVLIVIITGCNSNNNMVVSEKETITTPEASPTPYQNEVAAIDSVWKEDTVLHPDETLVASDIFEWKVHIKGFGGTFKEIIPFKDSSFIGRLNISEHPGTFPSGFFDSKGRRIMENNYVPGELLLKVDKNGAKQWLAGYSPKYDFFSLISPTITKADKVVSLVAIESNYFIKKEEERRYEKEMSEAEGENYEEKPIDYSADLRCFGLEFLNDKGATDSIVSIDRLDPDIEVLAFKSLLNDRFVLAGNYYQKLFKTDSAIYETSGSFIVMVNTNGKLIWWDKLQTEKGPGGVFLEVSDSGEIYFCSEHSGEVKFSKGRKINAIQTNKKDSDSRTYLVSYSKNGSINWIRNNETNSSTNSLKVTPNGLYLAHLNYGNSAFNHPVDTSGLIREFLTFFDKQGNYLWSKGLPIDNIYSIVVDSKGFPFVMGNNNLNFKQRPITFEDTTLNTDGDLAVIGLTPTGKFKNIWARNFNLEMSSYVNPAKMILGADNSFYIICESNDYFKESYNNYAHNYTMVRDISFLGKLRMQR